MGLDPPGRIGGARVQPGSTCRFAVMSWNRRSRPREVRGGWLLPASRSCVLGHAAACWSGSGRGVQRLVGGLPACEHALRLASTSSDLAGLAAIVLDQADGVERTHPGDEFLDLKVMISRA